MNLKLFPDGCPCEIAARVEGMSGNDILSCRFNPYPHIKPEAWSEQSIAIHGITPDDVIGQPLLENGVSAFYRLVTVDKRCRCIVVAYNSSFDKSRIGSCA